MWSPMSPCAPSHASWSVGYVSVSSTCAASGAIRPRARARTTSRTLGSIIGHPGLADNSRHAGRATLGQPPRGGAGARGQGLEFLHLRSLAPAVHALAAVSSNAKVIVVMPAYNAGRTLRMTYEELPKDAVARHRPAARARDLRPQPELRLRRQPEDLLRGSAPRRSRRRRHGPPRLSVRPAARPPDHRADPPRRGRRGAGLTAQDGLGAPAGDAVVEVRLEPLPHGAR